MAGTKAEPMTPQEGLEAAANGKTTVTPEVSDAALQWFLDETEPTFERTLEINVGEDGKPNFVKWTIRALSGEEIAGINRQASGNRGTRRATGGERDLDEVQRRVVALATVNPNLAEVVKLKGADTSMSDPLWAMAGVLAHRFRHKPGLITQLSGEVMDLSGYDEDDVRGVTAGKD